MFDIDELERAAEVVHKVLPQTPQIRWPGRRKRKKSFAITRRIDPFRQAVRDGPPYR